MGHQRPLMAHLVSMIALCACGARPAVPRPEASDASLNQDAWVVDAADARQSVEFVRRKGQGLMLGNAPYRLRGVTFSSNYYGATGSSITDPNQNKDHAPED